MPKCHKVIGMNDNGIEYAEIMKEHFFTFESLNLEKD